MFTTLFEIAKKLPVFTGVSEDPAELSVKLGKYIESQHEYIKIFLIDSPPVLTQMSLKSAEALLPPDLFMRVHRSFIVRLSKISVIDRNRIVFDGKIYIPVSDQYKEKFQNFMDGNSG